MSDQSVSSQCIVRRRKGVHLRSAVGIFAVAAAAGSASVSVQAQDCGAILTKMKAAYTGARSYSASIIMHQKGKTKDGKAFSITSKQSIRFKAPNQLNVSVALSGQGVGSEKFSQGDKTIVDDGKILTIYIPSRKAYGKRPSPPAITVPDLLDVVKRLPTANADNIVKKADASVNGRSAFIIEIKPKMQAGPVHVSIDKSSYTLLRITESSNGTAVDIDFNDQLFNGNIAASTFNFVPPPGATEMKPPAANAQPGNPAAPRVLPGTIPPTPLKK